MVHFMEYDDNFAEFCKKKDRKIIIYGTSVYAEAYSRYVPDAACACNTYADGKGMFLDLHVLCPQDLEKLEGELTIIIFVKRPRTVREIKEILSGLEIEAYVFEFGNNIAFNCYHPDLKKDAPREIRTVRLVRYGEREWILGKFASRMQEELEKRGIRATVGGNVDEQADINHHLDFWGYEPVRDNRDTIMITHVLHKDIAERAIHQLKTARMGICMSRETMDKLVLLGAPREKLCYINPAHDGNMKPKKYVLGITHRNYTDYRKRQGALLDICRKLEPEYFAVKIMGRGWEEEVRQLRAWGFEVTYFPDFVYETYMNLIPTLDYFLFWGFDEGTMGYLDAVAAGVETLVSPQGFHLDVKDGITHSCRTVNDFTDILLQMQNKRKKRIEAVKKWTWEKYVDKHVKIWNYVLGNEDGEDFYENQHIYEDGENSVFRNRNFWD